MAQLCLDAALKHGTNLQEFAEQTLFKPLGMHPNTHALKQYPDKNILVSAHMKILPRDLVKIGELIRHNGCFQGEEIVSPEWINESTIERNKLGFSPKKQQNPFGYLWNLDPDSKTIFAKGFPDNNGSIYNKRYCSS